MTCKDCIHSGLCYKENEYNNFPDRCGEFISIKVLEKEPQKGKWQITKACKCDKCGELFPVRENSTPYRIEKYEGDWTFQELDLCDICMKKFEDWMTAATQSADIPEKPEKLLIKDKPLEMRFAGYSPHDCESRWICPNPDCDHVYGSWWFYNKKLHAHDTFVCEGCHSLLEVPEEEI